MELIQSLNNIQLSKYISKQLNNFFPDNNKITFNQLLTIVESNEPKLYNCFSKIPTKHFIQKNKIYFNHLHCDQYAMFLTMLSRCAYELEYDNIATKLYYLNKTLHSIDIYFRTQMPNIFLFVHPIGSILGRGTFSDFFVMYQQCTVGCLNKDVFPVFKGRTIMYSNSSVLGDCTIGDNVCIAANTSVINTNVPDNTTVIGTYPNYKFKKNNKDLFKKPPFFYDK